jgi:hypothetical protein
MPVQLEPGNKNSVGCDIAELVHRMNVATKVVARKGSIGGWIASLNTRPKRAAKTDKPIASLQRIVEASCPALFAG